MTESTTLTQKASAFNVGDPDENAEYAQLRAERKGETREQRRRRLFPQTAGGRCVGLSRAEVREERIALALEALALCASAESANLGHDQRRVDDLLATIKVMRDCDHREHRK